MLYNKTVLKCVNTEGEAFFNATDQMLFKKKH